MDQLMQTLPEPMQINGTFLYILVLFLCLFFILKKFYVESYAEVLERREDILEGAERKFHDVNTLFEEKTAHLEQELDRARANAAAVRERLVAEARAEREAMVSQARTLAQEQKAHREAELAEALNAEKQAAGGLVEELAARLSEQLVGRKL